MLFGVAGWRMADTQVGNRCHGPDKKAASLGAAFFDALVTVVLPYIECTAYIVHLIEFLPWEELEFAGCLLAVFEYCNLFCIRTIAEMTVSGCGLEYRVLEIEA